MQNLTGEAGVQGPQEPGAVAGAGTWGIREEAGTDSVAVYACARPAAGEDPCQAASRQLLRRLMTRMLDPVPCLDQDLCSP